MEKLVEAMLHTIIEGQAYNERDIQHYFSPKYKQIVDQVQLDFAGFKQHIHKLKELIASVEITILNTASRGNTVFTKHLVSSVLKDGICYKHKVMAEFTIEEGKITRCEELTLLIEGLAQGKQLGAVV
ncbi:nuclear transport factor 2-like protein [Myroides fluvii]|uniref:nuclear transport factor 2 family protein n=1 Tax=Myroides fluvii TaxID=2572594 RepID=UPI00131B07AD|nr:nuclear transport factor 2 family protein [Myroides fluvii]